MSSSRTDRIRLGLTAAAVCGALLATGCDPTSAPLVRHQAAFQPDGDGGLRIWAGQRCPGITSVTLEVEVVDGEPRETRVMRSVEQAGASLEELSLDDVPDGFDVRQDWPETPDWESAETVWVKVTTANGQTSSYVSVQSMLEDAADQDDDASYVEDEGWFTRDELRAEADDEEGLAPLCGPGTPAD